MDETLRYADETHDAAVELRKTKGARGLSYPSTTLDPKGQRRGSMGGAIMNPRERRQIDDCPALGADVLVAARFTPCRERRRPFHRLHRPATALRAAWPDQQCSDVVKHTPAH